MIPTDEWKLNFLTEETEKMRSLIEQTKDDPEQHEGFKMILKDVRIWYREIGKKADPDKNTLEWRIDYLEDEINLLICILEDQIEEGLDTTDLEEEIDLHRAWILEMRSQIRNPPVRSQKRSKSSSVP